MAEFTQASTVISVNDLTSHTRQLVLLPDDVRRRDGDLFRFGEARVERRAVVAAELRERELTLLAVLQPPQYGRVRWCRAHRVDGDADILDRLAGVVRHRDGLAGGFERNHRGLRAAGAERSVFGIRDDRARRQEPARGDQAGGKRVRQRQFHAALLGRI